jgi:hypothetical protein
MLRPPQRLDTALLARTLPTHHCLARYTDAPGDLGLGFAPRQQPRSASATSLELLHFLRMPHLYFECNHPK